MTSKDNRARVVAYVGLGSNLADPIDQVRRAMVELAGLAETDLLAQSALYRTDPVGPVDQPEYVNAVVRLETALSPLGLLDALHRIERAHGRRRDGSRWGPRTLDLDLLLFGDTMVSEPGLRVPHLEMGRRAFVLIPLAEVAPLGLLVPGMGSLAELLERCPRQGVVALGDG